MTKKNFKTPFDQLLEGNYNENQEADQQLKNEKNSIYLKRVMRTTLMVNESRYDKIKAIAFWQKKMLKDVVDEALKAHIEEYENQNGPTKMP